MRGHWENDTTMFIQLINIGEVLNDTDFQMVFSEEEVSLLGTRVVIGQEIELHGKRITK